MISKATHRLLCALAIALSVAISPLLSQVDIECDDHIEFCYRGWNKIYMEQDPGSAFFYFFSSSWSSSATNTFYESPYFYFLVDNSIPSSGEYRFTNDGSNTICQGTYSTYNCHDYILFEREQYCEVIIIFKPTDPFPVYGSSETYHVCLGDTTPIYLSPQLYQTTDIPNSPLTADRLNIRNGYLIDIDEYTAKIVWNAVGIDSVALTTTDECGFQWVTYQTFNVKVNNEINIITPDNSSELTVCVGESVYLDSDVGEAYYILWRVSDGRISHDKSLELAFDTPGQYTITLEDQDECNCSDVDEITVNVQSGASPQITCTSTICENTSVTYYSEDFCDSYLWTISGNGTITDGGGPSDYFISIDWGVGPEGVVELETPGCYDTPCRESVVTQIPIIGSTTTIEGLDVVCLGQRSAYSVPYYAGTTYNWSVKNYLTGGVMGGMSGQSTNKISIAWVTSVIEPIALIEVEYENCTLGCSGSAEMLVNLLPRFSISAVNSFVCLNDWISITEESALLLDFTILSPSGGMITFPSVSNLYFQGTEEGVYLITATNPNNTTCNLTEELKIVVAPKPELPSAISNNGIVCKGENTTFNIDALPSNHSVLWKVYDGDLLIPAFELTTKTLNYVWKNDEPYKVEAHLVDVQTGCVGEAISEVFSTSINISGEDTICEFLEGSYTISNPEDVQVIWSISPDSTGVIISRSNSELNVIWSEVGNHQVFGEACGKTVSYSVDVVNYVLDLTYPDSVCIGGSGAVIVNAPIGSTVEYFDDNDSLIANGPMVMLGKGDYSVVVNTPSMCIDGAEFSIYEYEKFEVVIQPDGSTSFCMPSSPINLISSAPPGTYTYEWFRDDILLAETSSILSTNEYGIYYVIATNEHGCKDNSNRIILSECCGDSYSNCNAPSLLIDVTDVDCFEKDFAITNMYVSDTLRWDFDDVGSSSNTAYGPMVSHVFSGAGVYHVTVSGNKNCMVGVKSKCGEEVPWTCCESGSTIVVINAHADFDVDDVCVGVPIEISNETKKIAGYTGETYSWDFGDPSSVDNTSTDFEPTHIYSTAGIYMITLTVTDHLGCSTTAVKEVTIHPVPIVVLDIADKGCQGIDVQFETTTSFDNLKFRWNFGDDNSGYYNKSKEANPTHIYTKQGTYIINLEVESEYGCVEHYSKNIEIVFESNVGDIMATNGFYKCPEDSIILSAPSGDSYLWNTAEISQSITVADAGEYEVIVKSASGCEYIPQKAVVSDIDLTHLKIYGATRKEGIGAVLHFDSMTLCKGQFFVLEAQKFQDVIFTWSIGNIEAPNLRYYEDGLAGLDIGRHEVTVTARHSILGCDIILDPFIVNIIEALEPPIIISSTPDICNGGETILSVQNPLPGHIYVWNYGQVDTSITASSIGENYVFVQSPFGCESPISNRLYVNNIPLLSPWIGGCHEVCFPFEVCINLHPSFTYELIRNETETIAIDASTPDILISDPGDYELIVVSSRGCRSKSEMLSLSALPENQGLSGIVFFDENTNGTFEVTDTLLENIPVILCNGNTPVDTTITDINGNYSFADLSYPNLIAKVDLSNTPYAEEGGMDTLVIFSDCIELKALDFPVVSECVLSTYERSFEVCAGEMIRIDGTDYTSGQKDTLIYAKQGLCDSIIYISVDDFELPEVALEMSATCHNDLLGLLSIDALPEDSLLFRIDENSSWVTDTLFSNLSAGSYDLYILSKHGCIINQAFEIDTVPVPVLEISTISSCIDTNNGEVDFYTISSGVLFSMDGGLTYDSNTHFDNLAVGMHTVDFSDEHGCLYQRSFEIEPNQAPEVSLSTVSTCPGMIGGSLLIDILLGDNLMFSIDGGISFNVQTEFLNLEEGSYFLDIVDGNSCAYRRTFEIEKYPETSFEIETTPLCSDLETGSLIVYNPSVDMQYKIDDAEWSDDLFYEGLSAGSHAIYSRSYEGCLDSVLFDIELGEIPFVYYEIFPGCEEIEGGLLTIDLESSLMIALDDGDFVDQVIFSDISSGSHVFHVMNDDGCTYDFPFEILEIAKPQIDIETTPSCFEAENGSATMIGMNPDFDLKVMNDQGAEIEGLQNLEAGEYSAIAINDYNCEYIYPFTILEQEEPFVIASAAHTCNGEEGGRITIEDRSANSLISLDGGEFVDDSTFENLQVGIHELVILDSLLCSSIVELEILPFEELIVEVPTEAGECFGSPILLTPEILSHHGEVDFLWNDGSTDFQRMISASEKVSLTVSDYCSSKTFEIDIEIANELAKESVYIPNIFSPNGDGVNDCFQVTVDASVSLAAYRQIIFDRWGNKLFESDDIDYCWDGLFNGVELVEGVYVYITEATAYLCEGEKKFRKVGDVTIIK